MVTKTEKEARHCLPSHCYFSLSLSSPFSRPELNTFQDNLSSNGWESPLSRSRCVKLVNFMEPKRPLFPKESWLDLQALYTPSWFDGNLSVLVLLTYSKPQMKILTYCESCIIWLHLILQCRAHMAPWRGSHDCPFCAQEFKTEKECQASRWRSQESRVRPTARLTDWPAFLLSCVLETRPGLQPLPSRTSCCGQSSG